jgi:NAD(P)H-hydrate epimerase
VIVEGVVQIEPSGPEIPYLTTPQMIEVDRAMIEDYRIELIQMMENAGRNLAHLARVRFLGGDPRGKRVMVLAGSGGNGGGALVAARRLSNWGAAVEVMLGQSEAMMAKIPAHQLSILHRIGIPIAAAVAVAEARTTDLVLDGLIGYSLKGAPFGTVADLIRWANRQTAPVLSLDAPSGIDTTTGTVFDPAVRATATMTLALPKEGLRTPGMERQMGELYLADISVPPALYERHPLNVHTGPLFAKGEVIRLR